MRIPRTRLRRPLATTAALAAVAWGVTIAPAHADPQGACNPNFTRYYGVPETAVVDSVITYRIAVPIAPGTTGSRTVTMTKQYTVTTQVNNSTDFTVDAKTLFGNVSTKVGFQVSDTMGSTDTTQTTETFNFLQPDYYLVYQGTRRVQGEWIKWICARTGYDTGYWLRVGGPNGVYQSFEYPEQGVVSCSTVAPPGSLRAKAKQELGC
ncbi:hypothetical protein [Embleya sp. NPDC020630]|uniref:hypothetical protein n=1 Tax=Embleya sp. NPDC020630 TaxID=3363979 RepID=UPI0037BB871F